MLKLYGFPLSNYFNMVKIILIEKGVDYEFISTMPSQESDYLSKSPMGKVPCIETDDGFLSETNVIMEYLEDSGEGPSLFPSDPFEKASVRELMKEMELYIELPARTCYPETFFGGKVSDEVKETAKANLQRGMDCLKRNAKFSPYVAGDELTYADFFFMYSVNLANSVAKRLWHMDLLAELPEAQALMQQLGERESAKQIAADQKQ
jgi:glutathione S-transferase|tara:strand:- start:9250 stop:9870 length:621 start_codon:yes stop_codon:yes gene_type:complete